MLKKTITSMSISIISVKFQLIPVSWANTTKNTPCKCEKIICISNTLYPKERQKTLNKHYIKNKWADWNANTHTLHDCFFTLVEKNRKPLHLFELFLFGNKIKQLLATEMPTKHTTFATVNLSWLLLSLKTWRCFFIISFVLHSLYHWHFNHHSCQHRFNVNVWMMQTYVPVH